MFTGKKSDSVTYWNNYTKFWLYSWMTIYECYCSIVFTVVFLATLTAVNPCKLYWWLSCWNNWYKTSVNSKMPRKKCVASIRHHIDGAIRFRSEALTTSSIQLRLFKTIFTFQGRSRIQIQATAWCIHLYNRDQYRWKQFSYFCPLRKNFNFSSI